MRVDQYSSSRLVRSLSASPAPLFGHLRSAPGVSIVADGRNVIACVLADVPRGAALRITTRDPKPLSAVHELLASEGRPA